jgi:hypothetical protein
VASLLRGNDCFLLVTRNRLIIIEGLDDPMRALSSARHDVNCRARVVRNGSVKRKREREKGAKI